MTNNLKDYRENYIKLNRSFSKELIYPLTKRGFYSEINNLLLAILYCLEKGIRLKIYTGKWINGKWEDYFCPFLEEYKGIIPIPASNVFFVTKKEIPFYLYHKHLKGRLLIQDNIWTEMRSDFSINNKFSIAILDINGDFFEAKKQLIKIFLKYNAYTKETIELDHKTKKFVANSFGLQIRRGDKITETKNTKLSDYIQKAKLINPKIKNFTICTDDYTVIEEFKKEFPEFVFYTLCPDNRKGYSQTSFNKIKDKRLKKQETINLLKDSYLLYYSEYFIGTYSSNISRYITLIRNNNNCYSMDIDWHPY